MSKELLLEGENIKPYKIVIENNNKGLVDNLKNIKPADTKICIISDSNVAPIHGETIMMELLSFYDSVSLYTIEAGEENKNLDTVSDIYANLISLNFNRNDMLVALGGGVVGDITGFAASTYMRGIEYIQIPTTLLAMVDSSVGGKTAIDITGGKNSIGTFHQPGAVFININFLKTLDKRQLMSGLGEVLKYAFIEESCEYEKSVFLFEFLTLCKEKFFELDSVTLIRMIDYSLKLKIAVVEKDEKESGLRKVLNFGHTLAHAIESATNYKKYTHGEAVVYGMFFALNLAFKKGLINYSYYRLSVELIENFGFKNISLKKIARPENLIKLMEHDKKATHNGLTLILPCAKKKVKGAVYTSEEIIEFLK